MKRKWHSSRSNAAPTTFFVFGQWAGLEGPPVTDVKGLCKGSSREAKGRCLGVEGELFFCLSACLGGRRVWGVCPSSGMGLCVGAHASRPASGPAVAPADAGAAGPARAPLPRVSRRPWRPEALMPPRRGRPTTGCGAGGRCVHATPEGPPLGQGCWFTRVEWVENPARPPARLPSFRPARRRPCRTAPSADARGGPRRRRLVRPLGPEPGLREGFSGAAATAPSRCRVVQGGARLCWRRRRVPQEARHTDPPSARPPPSTVLLGGPSSTAAVVASSALASPVLDSEGSGPVADGGVGPRVVAARWTLPGSPKSSPRLFLPPEGVGTRKSHHQQQSPLK